VSPFYRGDKAVEGEASAGELRRRKWPSLKVGYYRTRGRQDDRVKEGN
jgi:hypothetical protein